VRPFHTMNVGTNNKSSNTDDQEKDRQGSLETAKRQGSAQGPVEMWTLMNRITGQPVPKGLCVPRLCTCCSLCLEHCYNAHLVNSNSHYRAVLFIASSRKPSLISCHRKPGPGSPTVFPQPLSLPCCHNFLYIELQ
jgi:hypothetical protein